MWTQYYDLHSHSTNSDGEHSVDHVAKLMKDNEVKFWSLTDHDTISGWKMAQKSAEQMGINFCLLYTSPSPRDGLLSRMPSSA